MDLQFLADNLRYLLGESKRLLLNYARKSGNKDFLAKARDFEVWVNSQGRSEVSKLLREMNSKTLRGVSDSFKSWYQSADYDVAILDDMVYEFEKCPSDVSFDSLLSQAMECLGSLRRTLSEVKRVDEEEADL